MHTRMIKRASADRDGRWAVTGSTTRRAGLVAGGRLRWHARSGCRPGPVNVGKVYAVAISPDGTLIAAGGWTRTTSAGQEQIYLFDRESGAAEAAHRGPAGCRGPSRLLAGRHAPGRRARRRGPARLYQRRAGWAEVARDETYGDQSLRGGLRPRRRAGHHVLGRQGPALHRRAARPDPARPRRSAAPGGEQPLGIAFSPDGRDWRSATTTHTRVDLLDARTLAPLATAESWTASTMVTFQVAWSRDGSTLFAAGGYRTEWAPACSPGPAAARVAQRVLPAGTANGDEPGAAARRRLLVAAADPWLARLAPDGVASLAASGTGGGFRRPVRPVLTVSADGARVGFGYPRCSADRPRASTSRRGRCPWSQPPTSGLTAAAPDRPADRTTGRANTTRRSSANRCRLAPYESLPQPRDPPERRPLRARDRLVSARLRHTVARRSGPAWRPAPSGRSTSPATAGWSSRPMVTAPSAGTAWRTGPSCSPSCRWPTRRTGSPGPRKGSTTPRLGLRACSAGS